MKLLINLTPTSSSWDAFVLNHPQGNLLQSWAWGEFQASIGNKVWRLQVSADAQVITQLQIIKLHLGFGKHILYAPRDLLINKFAPAQNQPEAIKLLMGQIKQIASEESAILLRLEPPISKEDRASLSIYKSIGFLPSIKSLQPSRNLIIDILPAKDLILKAMKPKARYNIAISYKKGVQVVISSTLEAIKIFNQLNKETSFRNRFHSYSDNYYYQQLNILGHQHKLMTLLIAYWQDTPLASALITCFGKRAIYLHGASSKLHADKMASYALHWEAIKLAKSRGCSTYDLGGVIDDRHPQWAGITRFKQGFGGEMVEYVGALELPFNPLWYKAYQLLNKLRG